MNECSVRTPDDLTNSLGAPGYTISTEKRLLLSACCLMWKPTRQTNNKRCRSMRCWKRTYPSLRSWPGACQSNAGIFLPAWRSSDDML